MRTAAYDCHPPGVVEERDGNGRQECLPDPNLLLHSDQVIKHLLLENLPLLRAGDYANLDLKFLICRPNHVSVQALH
jgi:hypothetical protein